MAKKVNNDGMRYPSIDDLVKKEDTFTFSDGTEYKKNHTKYQVAYLAAKRAQEIEDDLYRKNQLEKNRKDDVDYIASLEEKAEVNPDFLCVKPVGIALEEYLNDEVHIAFKSDNVKRNQNKNED